MFNKFKVIMAKNKALIDLVDKGTFDKAQGDLMREIAGNAANLSYGTSALKHRVVKDSNTAAATVFARLAVYYQRNPTNGLTVEEWKLACRNALIFAGASQDDAGLLTRELINTVQNGESDSF